MFKGSFCVFLIILLLYATRNIELKISIVPSVRANLFYTFQYKTPCSRSTVHTSLMRNFSRTGRSKKNVFNYLFYRILLCSKVMRVGRDTSFDSFIQNISKNQNKKYLKGSLDLIPSPSPSVKIQIMGGKVCLRCKGKTLLGFVNKLLKTKSLLTSPSNVFALLSQVKFSANNLNFHCW